LDALELQSFSGSDFSNILSPNADEPLVLSASGVELAQSTFGFEAETQGGNTVTDVSYSDGEATEEGSVGATLSFDFNTDYLIPEEYVVAGIRFTKTSDTGDPVDFELRVDNFDPIVLGGGSQTTTGDLIWVTDGYGEFSDGTDLNGSHTLNLEITSSGADLLIADYVFVGDGRYLDTSNLDNTVHDDNGYLDDPKLYPDKFGLVDLPSVTTDIALNSATVAQSYTDITNNQELQITPPATVFNNSDTETVDYTSRVTEVQASFSLSRYPVEGTNPQSATPRFGYNGQVLQDHELSVNLDAVQRNEIGEVLVRSFTGSDTANGSTIAEGGQQSNGTLITRARVPEFIKQSGQRVVSSERLRWINDPEN
jgi:hypothetical protein